MNAAPTPIGIAVVEEEGRFLVGTRPEGTVLAGFAEFPGGKVLPGESTEGCAARECFEETGLRVEPIDEVECIAWEYPHGRVELHFIRCRVTERDPPTPPFRWVTKKELATLRFPDANARVISTLLARE